MCDLLGNLSVLEQKYFKEKYLLKNISIPYLKNEHYRYWFLGKKIEKNKIKLIHDYISKDLNKKIIEISEYMNHDTIMLNRQLPLEYKENLYIEYSKYKGRLIKNKYYQALKNNKKKSLEETRLAFNEIKSNLISYEDFFESEKVLDNLLKLISDKFGVKIEYDKTELNKKHFDIHVSINNETKKISLSIIPDVKEHNNISYFQFAKNNESFIGDLVVYKEFDITNKDKLSVDGILRVAHELGHAFEEILSEKHSVIEKALNDSDESVSLLFELISIKNMGTIIGKNLKNIEKEYLEHWWNFDGLYESIYCINVLNGNILKNTFQCDSFEETYELYLESSIKDDLISLYDFYRENRQSPLLDFDIYLNGYKIAEELYESTQS